MEWGAYVGRLAVSIQRGKENFERERGGKLQKIMWVNNSEVNEYIRR